MDQFFGSNWFEPFDGSTALEMVFLALCNGNLLWHIAMEHEIPASSKSRFTIHACVNGEASSERRREWGFYALRGPRPISKLSESRFTAIHEVNGGKASTELNLCWWEEQNVEARSTSDITSK